MGMFEQFPYTNFHELNLDWLIDQIQKIKSTSVLSVNGQTGDVILYQNPEIRFPDINSGAWRMVRTSNGTNVGIAFNEDYLFLVNGDTLNLVYSANHQPPYPVRSVNNQTGDVTLYQDAGIRFPDTTDNYMNLRRQIQTNGTDNIVGIEVKENKAYRIKDTQRHEMYDANNPPPYPVTSVNGQTGDVNIVAGVSSVNGQTGPVVLAIPFDAPLTDSIWIASETSADHTAGMARETVDGTASVYLVTSGTDVQAFVHFVSADDQVSYTRKLLTSDDIPSSSGVVSINGQTGVVVMYGTMIERSSTDNTDIDTALTNVDNRVTGVNNALAPALVNMTPSVNIPAGDFCQINGVFYKNISGAVLPAGTAVSMSALQAIDSLGLMNEEFTHIALNDSKIVREASSTHVFNVPENSFNLFMFDGNGGSRIYSALVYRAFGTVTLEELAKGSGIDSVTVSGGTFTISMSSGQAGYARVVNVNGGLIS